MYISKLDPWQHQLTAREKLAGRKFYALLMQMRTGKTKVVLDDFIDLFNNDLVDDLLVLAPAGVYLTWIEAFKQHVGGPLAAETRIMPWISGGNKTFKMKLDVFLEDKEAPRIFLVNIEALSKVKESQDAIFTFCKGRRVYCVVDESTCIKNPNSKRTKFILENLRPLFEYRRILTGLVAPKDPLDVYAQFEFLEPGCLGYSTFTTFSARYAIIKKRRATNKKQGFSYNYIKPVAFRDEEELAIRIGWHSYRVKLSDCYDLPPKIYEIRNVELTDEQERIYKEIKKYATAQLECEAHVTATQVMTQMMRLHQILMGHVKDEDGVERFIDTNRTQSLLDLIEEWDDGENKAIIWCAYIQDVANVKSALQKSGYKTASFFGGNKNEREDEEKRFKTDPETRFMIATAAAGGRGRTWTNADMNVYYSNTWDLEHREQSEERPQGIGKTNSVLYVDLVAVRHNGSSTMDMQILKALRKKINMASVLMKDGWRAWLI